MNPRQFFQHAILMRHAQVQYFRTRDKTIMEHSKSLEKEMDKEIANACLHDAEMYQFVCTEYPELLPEISKARAEQTKPSYDLFGNQI